ncbi:unnamed protein product [Schistosoma curassoni]|uniref:Uncharacterized protein n=1 Tax=Schistosoma curassoni TaxID=6186 RepID=A0A183KJ73_9TREM|nr:unnamed protein product [Schistosoma curassoni]
MKRVISLKLRPYILTAWKNRRLSSGDQVPRNNLGAFSERVLCGLSSTEIFTSSHSV